MRRLLLAALLVAAALPAARPAAAQRDAPDSLPEIAIAGPAVIAFWRVPASDSVLEADPNLATALDDHQYYWAETRPLLEAAGIAALDQPGLRFRVREPGRRWIFTAVPDSGPVGHLVLRPGRPPRVLYGRHFPDEVLAAARALAAPTAP